jgi:1-deoxy-D-xylulose-5-phosphate synthase
MAIKYRRRENFQVQQVTAEFPFPKRSFEYLRYFGVGHSSTSNFGSLRNGNASNLKGDFNKQHIADW